MSSINTVMVGLNAQPLAPAPVAGTAAASVTVINFDTENTVNLGSQASQLPLQLGPLASVTVTAPVWAAAATQQLQVGVLPGGSNYSPGSLTITGPVNAEITGPVTVEGTIDIGNSPTVDLAAGATVEISGTSDVLIQNASVNVLGGGGFINPGQVSNLFNTGPGSVGPGVTANFASSINVTNYTSVVLAVENLTNSSAAAGAAVCAIFKLVWSDSIGDETATDTVSLLLGANTNATWEIPVKGSFCTLQVQNIGTVGTITVPSGNIIIDGSYRTVPNVRVLQGFAGTPLPTLTGCTVLLQSPPVFTVAAWIASIVENWAAAVANMVFPIPQWAGQVTGYFQVTTTALVKNATVVDLTYALQGGVLAGAAFGNGIIQNLSGAVAANPVPLTFNLPPTQCAVIIDTPAAAGTFVMSLVGVGN